MDTIKNNFVGFAAAFLLGLMFLLAAVSSWNDTATFDEVAHIPAGYSYLTKRDFRINPEHPPLIKDLSAMPLLFLDLNFPTDVPQWSERIEDRQWDMGKIFLYRAGNDADQILRFSRFPVMLLALLFGWIFYKWVRNNYGNRAALIATFLYAMSPTVIAHSRYVTTDIGAAFGFFVALISFFAFVKEPGKKNIVIAGLLLGVTFLLKFSTVILAPIYIILGLLWVVAENWQNKNKIFKDSLVIIARIAVIGVIAMAVVWAVYLFHVWNFPVEQQISDINATLTSPGGKIAAPILASMSSVKILQPLAEYFFGVISVAQRAAGGNSAHFWGTVSSQATPWYFPTLYVFKESIVLHILTIIALCYSIKKVKKAPVKNAYSVAVWIKNNFAIVGSIIFIVVYALQSITGNLNIGHRHIMPTLPFVYFLVALQISRWMNDLPEITTTGFWAVVRYFFNSLKVVGRYVLVPVLLFAMMLSTLATFPYYLSYYNILVGGTVNGYDVATDSNYDWGQDMKRLRDWMDDNGVQKINLHYFGGADGKYYFGERYEDWWSSKGQPAPGSWFAISANARQGSMAKPVRGFVQKPEDTYSWLKDKEPVARAGSSIFIYKF